MFVIQKPDSQRVLSISPNIIYVFINEHNRKWQSELTTRINTFNICQKYIKAKLIDFSYSAHQTSVAGEDIDIHLYALCTVVHLIVRLFPTNVDDYTFLPDTINGMIDTNDYPDRLMAKLESLSHFLESQMLERLRVNKENLLCLPAPEDQWFITLCKNLSIPTSDNSDRNMFSFLNYQFVSSKNRDQHIYIQQQKNDFCQINPGFKVIIKLATNIKDGKKLRDIKGLLDIIVQLDNGEENVLDFKGREYKMFLLLVLITTKYGVGLPKNIFEIPEGRCFIREIWNYLYSEYNGYIKFGHGYINYINMMKANNYLRFRQSKGKSIDVTRNPFLTQLQCYWLTTDSVKVEGFDFNAYRIRLDSNKIIVEDKYLEENIKKYIPEAVCYTEEHQKEKEERHKENQKKYEEEAAEYERQEREERKKRFEEVMKELNGK